jgi:hypothetical protein
MKSGKSFISIDIDSSEALALYQKLSSSFSLEQRRKYNTVGAEAAQSAVQSYYTRKGRNLWINPSLPTHGPGRMKTRYADNVESGWNVGKVTGSGVRIQNNTIGLSHKVTGGTITAKRVKFLTIPVTPEAHGRTARQFSKDIGKLFAAKGCLMWKKADGSINAAYILKRSVNHTPWPNALPPDAEIVDAFAESALDAIERDII